MARKFLTPIDLNKLELQNVAIQNLATDPESPATGQVYYNTSLGKLKVYNGSSWVEVGNSQEQIEDYVNGLITAGDAISVSYDDNAGTLTIANTGVHSLTGTANEITVSAASGAVTLSLSDTINADLNGTAASATYAVTAGTANAVAADSVALGTDTTGNYVASISGTSNEIEVSGSGEGASVTIGLPSDVYISNDLNVGGNLVVSGSVTYIDTETLLVSDNIVELNSNLSASATPTENAGIQVNRGSADSTGIIWDESLDSWVREDAGVPGPGLLFSGEAGSIDISDFDEAAQDAVGSTLVPTDTISFNYDDGNAEISANVITASAGYILAGNNGLEVDYEGLLSQLLNDSVTVKFVANVGDTSSTSFNIDHNLGTRDVTVQVYDNSTYDTVEVDVTRPTTNRVTVAFATAPGNNAYRVVIVG